MASAHKRTSTHLESFSSSAPPGVSAIEPSIVPETPGQSDADPGSALRPPATPSSHSLNCRSTCPWPRSTKASLSSPTLSTNPPKSACSRLSLTGNETLFDSTSESEVKIRKSRPTSEASPLSGPADAGRGLSQHSRKRADASQQVLVRADRGYHLFEAMRQLNRPTL